MLSALAHAIHNDVRNNADQELNLSSHPLHALFSGRHTSMSWLSFTRQMERIGKKMGQAVGIILT
jgi:hypothetical protein